MGTFARIHDRARGRVSSSLARPQTATAAGINHTHPILRLQRKLGNRALQRLLKTNAGLKVGSTSPGIFRKPEIDTPPPSAGSALPITDRLVARQAQGEPLPAVTRQGMENAFGCDFADVRVHRDAEAGEISRQLSALAFTHGTHIYFRNGMYDPVGSAGKRLLAHELTHVGQQGHGARLGKSMATGTSPVIQTSAPTIQRFSYVEGKAVHPVNNLADTVLFGKDVGLTYFILNGAKVTTAAHVRAALKKPTLSFMPVKAGGFDARVQNVPINKGSIDETVLAARSWKLNATKAAVLRKFPHLTACRGAGRTIFEAIGSPSNPAMFGASRRHEDHHSDAFFSAFMGTIYWWDTELDVAAGGKTPFHGATKAAAEAALWKAMGGTPDQIADNYSDAAAKAINDYHDTPEGGPVSWDPDTAKADARCANSSVECTNPATI